MLQNCDKNCETYLYLNEVFVTYPRLRAHGSLDAGRRMVIGLMYNFSKLKLALPEH